MGEAFFKRVKRVTMDENVDSNEVKSRNRGGDLEVANLILVLWSRKKWIFAITSVATILGITYALLARPVYYSQAIIALKDSGKGADASRLFAQFGGMGGMVASQLGLGNTNLEKIEIMLKGHELAENVIRKNDLLPVLFPKMWNPKTGSWIPRDPAKIPTLRKGIARLSKGGLVVSLDLKKSMIKVGMFQRDSLLAKKFVDYYLEELNTKIRSNVINDAEINRGYLEKQLNNTIDPILIEKIHGMIAFEIEKSMLVSTQAFEVLDKPIVPFRKSKPKRVTIVMLAFLMGLTSSIIGTFVWKGIADLK